MRARRAFVRGQDAVLLAAHVEPGDEVLALVSVLLVLELEDRTSAQHPGPARKRRVLGLRVEAIEPRLRERLALALPIRIAPRPVLLEEIATASLRDGGEVELGLAPVVVAEPDLLLPQARAELDAADVTRPNVDAERVERVEPGLALVGVGEHQQARARAVLDVVADAVLFEQARDESQVALVVLDAVRPDVRVVETGGVVDAPAERLGGGGEARGQPGVVFDGGARSEREVRVALEDGVDDLARRFFEEDAAPRSVLRPHHRRHQDGPVEHALRHGANLFGLDEDAVEELVGGGRERGDPERGPSANQMWGSISGAGVRASRVSS